MFKKLSVKYGALINKLPALDKFIVDKEKIFESIMVAAQKEHYDEIGNLKLRFAGAEYSIEVDKMSNKICDELAKLASDMSADIEKVLKTEAQRIGWEGNDGIADAALPVHTVIPVAPVAAAAAAVAPAAAADDDIAAAVNAIEMTHNWQAIQEIEAVYAVEGVNAMGLAPDQHEGAAGAFH